MNRIPVKDLRNKVFAAMKRSAAFLRGAEGDTNPGIIAMVQQEKGKLIALEAVYAALDGNPVFLNIMQPDRFTLIVQDSVIGIKDNKRGEV